MMMTSYNLAFLLGIAAGIGITLIIEIVVTFLVWLLISGKEDG